MVGESGITQTWPQPDDARICVLRKALLSTKAIPTPTSDVELGPDTPIPDFGLVCEMCFRLLPVESELCNTVGGERVLHLMQLTLDSGLPQFRNNPQVHQLVCYGLRHILSELLKPETSDETRRIYLRTLLRAFVDCQQQQYHAISHTFGIMTCREPKLEERVRGTWNAPLVCD